MDATTSSYPVYVGFWTNWSQGRVLGSTLTLPRSEGALLIAFVAFFVAVVGSQFWRILCFILHALLSNHASQDALHNQRQVMLRNSASPAGGFLVLLKMIHAWRMSSAGARPFVRLFPLLLCTFLIAIVWAVASGLSSRIAEGNEVLIDGSNCGYIGPLTFNMTDSALILDSYESRRTEGASDYAQRCYESQADEHDCSIFTRRSLPISVVSNASCPFDRSICLSQDANIILDSGLMDSHLDMGLNSPTHSRFKLRYKIHCAPLVTDGYKSSYTTNNLTYLRYQYGDGSTEPSDCNCTFAVRTDSANERGNAQTSLFVESSHDYSFTSTYANFLNGSLIEESSVFTPIPELRNLNGDLEIIVLNANDVQFPEASPDIWYRASTPTEITMVASDDWGGEATLSLFKADEPAWPMGCLIQYEACIEGTCTGLGSESDVRNKVSQSHHTQPDIFGKSWYFGLLTYTTNIILDLGKKSLASRFKLSNGIQSGMESNSWHRDILHWFSISLATLQINLAEIARGPIIDGPDVEEFIKRPSPNERHQVCGCQKIRSTAYTSFNTFSLLFILCGGIFIIAVSATMERVTAVIQERYMPSSLGYARMEWSANDALQLHRLAHKEVGIDDWVLGPWEIPTTKTTMTLAVLQKTDNNELAYLQMRSNSNLSTMTDSNAEEPDKEAISKSSSLHRKEFTKVH